MSYWDKPANQSDLEDVRRDLREFKDAQYQQHREDAREGIESRREIYERIDFVLDVEENTTAEAKAHMADLKAKVEETIAKLEEKLSVTSRRCEKVMWVVSQHFPEDFPDEEDATVKPGDWLSQRLRPESSDE